MELVVKPVGADLVRQLFTVHTIGINTLANGKWELRHPPLNVAVERRGAEDFIACLYDVDL